MEGLKYIFIISLLKTYVHAEDPIIDTTTGKINGSTISVQNVELDAFLGIPFAKPPVGKLRFRRPEPVERWNDIKETKKHVSACEQIIDADIKENVTISEDCLYLNIWAPTEARKSRSNLTTMIWIYGGAFITGSSMWDAYDGRWLATSENIIVASLNYRVGAFGFLSLNDERAPGNMGLLDQTLAISWIHENIAAFGGDPDKLTLFGESAGAISISMHVVSPISRKYFRNAIVMSGTFNADWIIKSKKENIDRAKEMAVYLKCPTENEKLMLDCFLKANAKRITLGQFYTRNQLLGIPFFPIIDDYFLKEKSNEILQSKIIKKDVLIGSVKNEGTLFLLSGYPKYFTDNGTVPINKSIAHDLMKYLIKPVQLNSAQLDSIFYVYGSHVSSSSQTEKYIYILDQVLGDNLFKCPSINFSRKMSIHSNVYMYSFEFRSNGTPSPEWMGVTHGSEIYYVFSQALSAKNDSEEKSVSEMMSSYFANFSKSGNPNNGDCSDCSNEPWSKFTLQNQKYLVIGKKSMMENRQTSTYNVCSFWTDLLPQLKKPSCPVPACGSQNIWTLQGRILTFATFILFSLVLF